MECCEQAGPRRGSNLLRQGSRIDVRTDFLRRICGGHAVVAARYIHCLFYKISSFWKSFALYKFLHFFHIPEQRLLAPSAAVKRFYVNVPMLLPMKCNNDR